MPKEATARRSTRWRRSTADDCSPSRAPGSGRICARAWIPRTSCPEQARRRKVPIDHRTDVYSLGATLYEAVTGQPSFRGTDHADTLSQIIERDPVEPRKVNPRVPKDLETIVLQCLRKEPVDRYGTAEALEQDLRRLVRGDPVEARPQSRWERLARRARRHRTALVVTVAFLLLATFSGWLALERGHLEREREQAEGETAAAELGRREAEYEPAVRAVLQKLFAGVFSLEAIMRESAELVSYEARFPRSLYEGRRTLTPVSKEDLRRLYETRGAEAVKELQEVAAHLPGRRDAHYYLARALAVLGRTDEAHREIDETLRCDADFVPARALRWELAGKNPEELDQLSSEYEKRADWPRLWLEAYGRFEEKRWEHAEKTYTELLALSDEPYIGCFTEVYLHRGVARLRMGEYSSAQRDFVRADERGAGLEAYLLLGEAYYLAGAPDKHDPEDEAKRVFEELYDRAEPEERAEVSLWIAAVYDAVWDCERGLDWARGLRTDVPIRERLISYFLYRSGDTKGAIEAGREATARDGEDLVAHLILASALHMELRSLSGEHRARTLDELLRVSMRALELDPQSFLGRRLVEMASAETRRGILRILRSQIMNTSGTMRALLLAVLAWATPTEGQECVTEVMSYLGGQGTDQANDIARDADGNVYIVGSTNSFDFPVPEGWPPVELNGGTDALVVKLSPELDEILAVTTLGGAGDDLAKSVGITDAGHVVLVGETRGAGFPIEGDPVQEDHGGGVDLFVASLDPEELSLEYSTFFGGRGDENAGRKAQVDPDGLVSIVGFTSSREFPTKNPFQSAYGGGSSDTFVLQLRVDGDLPSEEQLVYSTLIGGSGDDHSFDVNRGLEVTEDGRISVTFNTLSRNLPVDRGEWRSFQSRYAGGDTDAYVAVLDPALEGELQLVYCTYFGGSSFDQPRWIHWIGPSTVLLTGTTGSWDFPQTDRNPYQAWPDVFVSILDLEAGALVYSTIFGGRYWDLPMDFELTASGGVLAVGNTASDNFPAVNARAGFGPAERNRGLIFEFQPGGSETERGELRFSTSLGGSGAFEQETLRGLARESEASFVFCGLTPAFDVPACGGLEREMAGGLYDILVGRFERFVEPGPTFLRGDCTGDSNLNLSDAACALNWLFAGGAAPGCIAALDTNGDATVELTDPVALLNYLFAEGSAPVAPFPDCGASDAPGDTELGCAMGCQ